MKNFHSAWLQSETLGAVLATSIALADVQTWMENPASAVWNVADLNWDEGVAWTNGNDAVFGETAPETITVDGQIVATNVTFSGGDHVLTGTTLTVSNICVNAGTLVLSNVNVEAYRIRKGDDAAANIVFDGAMLSSAMSSDAHTFLGGDVGAFNSASIGAGGLTVWPGSGDWIFSQPLHTAAGVDRDGGLVKKGTKVLILSGTGTNTFNGGILHESSQIRIENPLALGTGPIRVRATGSAFFSAAPNVVVTNKVIVESATESIFGSTDAKNRLTLRNVGTDGDNVKHLLWLGRTGGNPTAVTLALDEPESEAVGGIDLQGKLDFVLDGGTVKARSDAQSPFFTSPKLNAEKVARVTTRGVTFDTGGANTELGLSLRCDNTLVTNVVAATTPDSFESGTDGWSSGEVGKSPNGLPPGRQANGSAWCNNADYYTSNGEMFFPLRRLNYMSKSITVPEEGDWRVVFMNGCRPGYNGHKLTITVTVDAGTTSAFEQVFAPRPAGYTFRQFATDPTHLTAGAHTVKIETGTDTQDYNSLLFDMIRLERWEIRKGGAFTKTGVGTLTVTNLCTSGSVTVSDGTLVVADSAFDGTHFTVADDASLAFVSTTLTNAVVDVASGGALSFWNSRNLVANGDFELDVLGAGDYSQTSALLGGWSFTRSEGQGAFSGAQRNGGTMSANGWYRTPSGEQTAFVRCATKMSCSVTAPEDGTYRLSFLQCARNYASSFNLPLTVKVDDASVLEIEPRTAYYDYARERVDVELAAGAHTLAFEVGGAVVSGALLFIDDVRLEKQGAILEASESGNVFAFARGATIDLRNTSPIVLEKGAVTVDGKAITGGRGALQRAGLVVTGEGAIQIGPPDATIVIIR